MALLRGELDWVVMKCLEKQRDRRYDTANALVRDIQRYLADEVVEARPPSAGYRFQKFVRRNKGQVIATSLVLVAFFAGLVGTTLGLLEALDKEAAAVLARNQLATKNTALELSEAEVEKKNTILEQKQDRLEESLARTWLSPLAESPGPLNNAEIDALNELAIFRNDPLADRFMTEALLNNQGKRKLRARAKFAIQAVVGLDAQRRQEVERLLVNTLESADQTDEARTNVMLAAWEWGELSPPAAAVVAQAQFQALREMKDLVNFGTQIRVLEEVLDRMEPKEAARLSKEAAVTFVRDIDTTKDAYLLSAPLTCLGSVAAHLEPKEAAEAATTLTAAMAKSDDVAVRIFLSQGLLAVVARLEPKEAAALAATLVEAMAEMNSDSPGLQPLTRVLSAVAARMESREAVSTLARAISKTNNEFELNGLAKSLAAVAAHLKPKEATRVCTEAAAVLIQAMTKSQNPQTLMILSESLSLLTPQMAPADAARVSTEAAAALTHAISKYPGEYDALIKGLSFVASRMEPKAVISTLTQASQNGYSSSLSTDEVFLTLAMSETSQRGPLAAALSAAAEQLEPKEATRVCSEAAVVLVQAMTVAKTSPTLASLAQCLSAVVGHLEPKEAGEVASALAQAIAKTNSSWKLSYFAQVLSAVPVRLEPNDAKAVAAAFTLAMAETMGMEDEPASRRLVILAKSLSAVAACMEPKAAALVSTEAAIALLQTMTMPQNSQTLMILAESLSLLTPRMAPPDAVRVSTEAAAVLTQAIAKEPGAYDDVRDLVKGLSFVAPRMEPKAAATAAAMLTRNLVDPQKNLFSLGYLAEGLSAVAPRLGPEEASDLADVLTQSKLLSPVLFAEPLSAMAVRMESKKAVASLTHAMTKITNANNARANIIDDADARANANAIKSLAKGLSAMSDRMESKEAVDAAATLTQTIEALVRVASVELIGNENGVNAATLLALAESLAVVSDRMDSGEAAHVSAVAAAKLTQAMAKSNATQAIHTLAQGLKTVLGDSQRRRLSDQQLVELLKLPFCVGSARRTILDQLELRHRRKFVDQWEFVRFAEERRIRLDFTSPPQRN